MQPTLNISDGFWKNPAFLGNIFWNYWVYPAESLMTEAIERFRCGAILEASLQSWAGTGACPYGCNGNEGWNICRGNPPVVAQKTRLWWRGRRWALHDSPLIGVITLNCRWFPLTENTCQRAIDGIPAITLNRHDTRPHVFNIKNLPDNSDRKRHGKIGWFIANDRWIRIKDWIGIDCRRNASDIALGKNQFIGRDRALNR